MPHALPDVSGLCRVSDATWQELGRRLRDAGFTVQHLRSMWPSGFRIYERLQTAARLWHARRLRDPATYAYRTFILRDPVTDDEIAGVLGSTLVERLVEAGLLARPEPGRIVSQFDCRFFMGRLILCDDLSHGADAVFGAGPGTDAFIGLSQRRLRVARALDIGCGAGGAALWLAEHAERVVASDINPRALEFVRINAAMNGVRNVETRLGDLFETVGGEAFDLIISQPPFVPTPPGASPARYRNGGAHGDELVCRVLGALPRHLTADGRGVVVFERAVADSAAAGAREAVATTPTIPGARALVIAGAAVHAEEYSIRHASQLLRSGIAAFDEAVTQMRDHLARMAIGAIRPSICIAARATASPAWTEWIEAGDTLWDDLSEGALDRLFDGYDLLHRRVGHERPRIRIPEGAPVLHRESADVVYLPLARGHLFASIQFDAREWEIVRAWRRQEDVDIPEDLFAKVARVGLLDV